MLGLEEVDPFPVPSSPAMIQHSPSVKIPLGKEMDSKEMPKPSLHMNHEQIKK